MRYLGIDFGDAKVGFAVGEDETGMAFAREAFRYKNEHELFERIQHYINEDAIEAFVVGYPKNLDGKKTEQTKKIDAFSAKIKQAFNKDVSFIDERLTSYEAGEMIKAGSRQQEDAIAAQIILQNFLDAKK
jgi:putative Holliday junction resolvase